MRTGMLQQSLAPEGQILTTPKPELLMRNMVVSCVFYQFWLLLKFCRLKIAFQNYQCFTYTHVVNSEIEFQNQTIHNTLMSC